MNSPLTSFRHAVRRPISRAVERGRHSTGRETIKIMIKIKIKSKKSGLAEELDADEARPFSDCSVVLWLIRRASEKAESRCDFNLQDADAELLRRQKCPELGRKAEG